MALNSLEFNKCIKYEMHLLKNRVVIECDLQFDRHEPLDGSYVS